MAQYLIKEETLTAIADAIRGDNASSEGITIKSEFLEDDTYLKEGSVNIFYRMTDDENVTYEGNYWTLVEYSYGSNSNGDIVPYLYKLWDGGDATDPEEYFIYFETSEGPDGEIYDWWIKSGDSSDAQYSSSYILTNCIV